MEFKELDGRELIYTDELESLVKYNYQGRQLPRLKSYRVVCPRCLERNRLKGTLPYTKTNLSISSDFTIGHCYRCDAVFINELGISTREVDTEVKLVTNHFELIKYDCTPLMSCEPAINSMEATEYLHNRNHYINPDYFRLGWKSNKIFIPFFYENTLIYYQIRYIKPFVDGMKYFSPPIDYKPIYIPPVRGSYMWNPMLPTILVEGALTAIALRCVMNDEINIAAVLGNTLTEYQEYLLNRLGYTNLYIMMDDTDLSNKLKSKIPHIEAKVIHTDGYDAEECLSMYGHTTYKHMIENQLKSKQFELNFSSDIIDDYEDKPIQTTLKLGRK